MSKKTNQLLTYGALGVGAYFLFKELRGGGLSIPGLSPASTEPATGVQPATQLVPTSAGSIYSPYVNTAAGGNYGTPQPIVSPVYLGPMPSNLNPGAAVGGPVGTCMQRKGNTWTEARCRERLDALVSAFNNSKARAAADRANGDTAGAANWDNANAAHRADYFNLTGIMLQ